MRTKEKNFSDPAVGQGSRPGRSIVSDNRGLRGKVPASTRNWARAGRIQMERYTHSVYQTPLSPTGLQDFCPGPAKGIGNWAGADPSPLRARNVANEKFIPLLSTALILALLSAGGVGSLTAIATHRPSPRSGDWGPPGWALPAQAAPFPLGQEAQ